MSALWQCYKDSKVGNPVTWKIICDGVCPSNNKRFTYLLTYLLTVNQPGSSSKVFLQLIFKWSTNSLWQFMRPFHSVICCSDNVTLWSLATCTEDWQCAKRTFEQLLLNLEIFRHNFKHKLCISDTLLQSTNEQHLTLNTVTLITSCPMFFSLNLSI